MDKNTDKEKDELFETQPQIIENSDDNVIAVSYTHLRAHET